MVEVIVSFVLLAVPLSSQRFLDPLSLSRLQIKGVPLDLLDDVLLHNLSLETFEGTL